MIKYYKTLKREGNKYMEYANKFATFDDFVDSLRKNKIILGVLLCGSNKLKTSKILCNGGDIDLTIITESTICDDIGGIHFYIENTPLDCMIRSIDYFDNPICPNIYDLMHLDSVIIYDRDGRISEALEKIKRNWCYKDKLSKREINKIRFRLTHFLNKLNGRVSESIHCEIVLDNAFKVALSSYARIHKLLPGKIKLHLEFMSENDPILYNLFNEFFLEKKIEKRYFLLKDIIEMILEDYGGIWKKNEILFHLNSDNVTEEDEKSILNILFEQRI